MRLRKLALAVGLAGALGAEMASALGLGEIKLLSTLNQPLEAEIKLLQARELTENEILISLASNDDFQRAGIDRIFFLTDLRFEIDLDAKTGPVIRVTSRKPVMEPYLNFLLESQWPNGRILREYTLLMDLPVFSDDRASSVQSARTAPQKSVAAQPRVTQPARSQPAPAASESQSQAAQESSPTQTATRSSYASQQDGVYGPVSANDTLWEIALKVRPGREYSVQQTMLAIQRLNPEAFINNNINLLRKGQVLRVPSSSDIENVGTRQAIDEVAQQNSEWSGRSNEQVGAQLDGSKRQSQVSSRSETGVSGRLKVSGADTSESMQAGRAAGEVGGDSEALQTELSASLEQLDGTRRENADLKERVSELEGQIDTMERLLEVSSQELRALQLGTQDNKQGDDQTASVGATSAEQSSESAAVSTETAPAIAEQEKPKAVAPKPKADASKVVRTAKPKEPSFMDMVMDNILYIGGGLLAILAAVFLLMRRRKSDDEDEGLSSLSAGSSRVDEDNDALETALGAGVADDFDSADDEEVDLADEDASLDFDDDEPEELETGASETGDAVSEADIYIAYGKFDQAEEMLLKAVEADELNIAARLKLMEVYLETQNVDKFEYQYGEIIIQGNDTDISRADDLKDQFSGVASFDLAQPENDELDFARSSEEVEADNDLLGEDELSSEDELTLDEGFGLSFESELTSKTSEPELESDEIELTLDFDLDGSDTEAKADDLDFDLDFDDVEEEATAVKLDADEPLNTTEELSAFDGASLEFESDDSDEDTFDLDMDGVDLAALDEEVDALSADMNFADDVFGVDDKPVSLDDELLSFDDELTHDAELPLMDFDSEIKAVEPASTDALSDDAELSSDTPEDALDFDFDMEFTDEDASESEEFSLEDVPTLDDVPTLGEAPILDEAPVILDEVPAIEDVPTLDADVASEDEVAVGSDDTEFDLAADLGLDVDDFAAEDSDDDMFGEAMTDLPSPEDVMSEDMDDEDLDAELDFLADTDESATKLDLARAYIDMGDQDGAKDILGEVVLEGNDAQKKEAEELLTRMG